MNTRPTPESILQDMAQIQRLDRGTVSVIRQGPEGAYYNHQCYENGRNVSRYVPGEQVADLKEDINNHHRFQQLVDQYVELMVQKTRAERQAGSKKRPHAATPPRPGPGNPAVNGALPSRRYGLLRCAPPNWLCVSVL